MIIDALRRCSEEEVYNKIRAAMVLTVLVSYGTWREFLLQHKG